MLKNFVLETANAPGTSTTFNLGGAASGRLSFSGAGFTNGQVVFYVMDDGSQKEWGIGTFNTGSPNTMSRTTVLSNSAGTTAKLNFSGTTNVYNSLPAENTVYKDSTGKAAIPGTATNDNAPAGYVGEFAECFLNGAATNATVTISIASPAVLSWSSHPFVVNGNLPAAFAIEFTTTGALPTGLTAGVTYYATIINSSTLHLSTTAANALAGTYLTTTGSQSGVHTAFACAFMTANTPTDLLAMAFTAGDWEVWGSASPTNAGTNTAFEAWTNTASATIPAAPYSGRLAQWIGSSTSVPVLPVGRSRYPLSGAANIYLSAEEISNAAGSCGGYLCARRMR